MPVIKHVSDNTNERSSFRKLLVAWYTYHINFEFYNLDAARKALAETSHDFAVDLAMELGARIKSPDRKSPFTLPSKTFHETPLEEADEDSA